MSRTYQVALILLAPCLAWSDTKDTPVGMLLLPGDAKLIRANSETALDAKTPDLLFPGDSLRTGSAPATFLFCAGKTKQTLAPSSVAIFESGQVKVKSGKVLAQQPSGSCFLPQVVRLSLASQQHYGASMTRGDSNPEIPAVPRAKLPPAVIAQLEPLEKSLAASPDDPSLLAAIAAVFEQANLPSNAFETYNQLRKKFPDAVWVKTKLFDLEQTLAAQTRAADAAGPDGNTYALLVGVSKYKDTNVSSLQFADRDAISFADVLNSPRGGGVPRENIMLLTNEKATTAAVRNAFQTFLKQRADKKDTVVVMIAGHGMVEDPGRKKGYILTHDTDLQDLPTTAMPMQELRDLFAEQLSRVGRVLMFVDVCRSGALGTMASTSINNDVAKLSETEGDLFLFMASRPRELSYESPDFGGGHGVFSYFVMKGLLADADEDKTGKVTIDNLIRYVRNQVETSTKKFQKVQHPNEAGSFKGEQALSDLSKPGVPLARHRMIFDSRAGEPMLFAANAPLPLPQDQTVAHRLEAFQKAVSSGRLLEGAGENAMDLLMLLKTNLTLANFELRRNQLRVALEDKAQGILLKYLAGDQIPQTKDDFAAGDRYMEAARKLTPESLFLEGRQNFFKGRAMLFEKKYKEAGALLEQAVRIDPEVGYTFNALGISYLEQAQFEKAIPAFRDAAKKAPHWAYPLHNLALSYSETGDFNGAIRSYMQAMRLAPKVSYLPYNLGLVYQRTGRRKDAEKWYKQAMILTPDSPEPYNALGTVKASTGKRKESEQYYRKALALNPQLLTARGNLALLLASSPDRFPEAVQLWQQNLAQAPDHLPSILPFAEALGNAGRTKEAIVQYQEVIRLQPDYVAARMALAALLLRDNRAVEALVELREASRREPASARIFERIGDAELASGNRAAARAAYELSMKNAEPAARKALNKKLERSR